MDEQMTENMTLADQFDKLFSTGGSDESELLNTATKYTLRLSPSQIKCLSFIDYAIKQLSDRKTIESLQNFRDKYLQLKQYCNSQNYILRIFDFHSLRHYIGAGLNIDVKK